MSNKQPEETIRDGNIKASIWHNKSENGAFFSTTLARTYQDEKGDFHDTHSFSGSDLLRVSELARQAYGRTNELRREYSHSQEQGSDSRENERGKRGDMKTSPQLRDYGASVANGRDRQR